VGIRDFVENLKKHRDLLSREPHDISPEEREEALGEAELMVGMAEAASRELASVLANRRPNLPEEHALRFAQEVFAHLAAEEEAFKERLRANG
jgi:hypothetical protein